MSALTILLGGVDVTLKVDMQSVVMNLAGSQETASCEMDIVDVGNSVSATEETTLSVTEVGTAEVLFGGFGRSTRETVIATGSIIHVMAADYNSLLDRSIVVSDSRTAGESDHTRLIYFMTTYGTQFSSDYSKIGTLNGSMVAQKFIALTLRQALERVMGQASSNASYFVDPLGRLNYVDRTSVVAAPYNVRVGTPGGGEIAPEDFEFDRDSSNLANVIYVVGATAAGSGFVTDTTSIATYGRRERFVNAPDSDTHAKMVQVGTATLTDQKNPLPRGVFTAKSPYDGWRVGQSIVVTSAQHRLSAVTLRIAKITVGYLSGAGDRQYTIELGAPLPTISALLGSTFGAGGGFPWHSPGGPFHWPALTGVGGGTPGGTVSGAGACGCAPFLPGITDSFDRPNQSGLGTADCGYVWTDSAGTFSIFSNQAKVFDGDSESIDATMTGSIPFPMTAKFDLSSFSGIVDFETIVKVNGTAITATVQMSGTSSLSVTLTDGTNTATASLSTSMATSGTMHWTITLTASILTATIVSDTGTHTISVNRTSASPSSIATMTTAKDWRWTGSAASTGPVFDTLDIAGLGGGGTPSPGQPYPRSVVAIGDGVTTTFSTLTAFQTGSLYVWDDNVLVTPFAQNPTGSSFTLDFPPAVGESVTAAWTIA